MIGDEVVCGLTARKATTRQGCTFAAIYVIPAMLRFAQTLQHIQGFMRVPDHLAIIFIVLVAKTLALNVDNSPAASLNLGFHHGAGVVGRAAANW
jgi:hypothetical protein